MIICEIRCSEERRNIPSNDEVPKPIVRGGKSLGQGSDVLAEHLRVQNPRRTVPGRSVADRPKVEESHRADAPV